MVVPITAQDTPPIISLRMTSSIRNLLISRTLHDTCPVSMSASLSLGFSHHYLTILLDGKLYLAPIPEDVKVGSPRRSKYRCHVSASFLTASRMFLISGRAPVSGVFSN